MEHKLSWVEIKVSVPQAEADAVANFLIELGSNGIVEESRHVSPAIAQNKTSITLTAYLHNDANLTNCMVSLNKYFESLRGAAENKPIRGDAFTITEIEDEDWNEKWKSFFQPVKVTEHIVIKPSWRNYWKKLGELVIKLDPGMAFGTGTHPSTRLCLQAIEKLRGVPAPDHEESLLDVGTGSGILAIGAALLGFKQVKGIDIDVQAVECAKKNAANNALADQVLFESTPLHKLPGTFSTVVANILPQTLIDMKEDLIRHLAPSGYLILSGIIQERAQDVVDAFSRDLSFRQETREEEWSCLSFQNKTC